MRQPRGKRKFTEQEQVCAWRRNVTRLGPAQEEHRVLLMQAMYLDNTVLGGVVLKPHGQYRWKQKSLRPWLWKTEKMRRKAFQRAVVGWTSGTGSRTDYSRRQPADQERGHPPWEAREQKSSGPQQSSFAWWPQQPERVGHLLTPELCN